LANAPVQQLTWTNTLKTWHLFWRIARASRPSPFRWLAQPVSVAEQAVPAGGVVLRVRVYRPAAHFATMVLNGGFVPESIDDPRLVNFAAALAEIGFLVLTPDYPAVRALEFTPTTIDQIAAVLTSVRRTPDWGGSRPLAVIGLSYVGTLSLKAALRPDLSAPPEFLGVFGGYADFGELMRAVFQDVYRFDGIAVPVDRYGRFLVLRSAVDYFDPPPAERDRIRELALAIGRDRPSADINAKVATLSPAGLACLASMRAFHPDGAPERWARILRELRDTVEALSVREPAERLRSRLVILHSVYDHILPCAGSVALHRRFPRSTLTLTTIFTHVNPRLSPAVLWSQGRELRALFRVFGELLAFQV
jgi:pimeloyl-ACP methyl ester carboxylesterase